MIILFTGLSGSGKTTLANLVKEELIKIGFPTEVLDGDIFRKNISNDLGYSKEDRIIHLKRLAFIANILHRNNIITIIAAINPYENVRKTLFADNLLIKTVWITCELKTLIDRDKKGLYKRALLPDNDPNKIYNFTGINDIYEIPQSPDLIVDTGKEDILTSKSKILDFLLETISQNKLPS
jgi:adenylylsulfate kinase